MKARGAQRARGADAAQTRIAHDELRSSGQPLEPSTRAFFESRFQHDFSRVRVHAGPSAAAAARSVTARAFTSRNDIVFGAGQFAPHTPKGRWLLAHELAHVAQTKDGPGSPAAQVERDASSAATAVMRGEAAGLGARHDGTRLHRFGEPENLPEMTYISTQYTRQFLDAAVDFHQGWGLPVRRISSAEQMIDHLAKGSAPVGRVRLVAHSAPIGLFSSLFTGEPLESLTGERLLAYGQSDAAGLALDTAMDANFGGTGQLVDEIRSSNPDAAALLTPFGLQTTGEPSGQLDEFFVRVAQGVMLRQTRPRKNAARHDALLNALPVVLDHVAGLAAGEFSGASKATVLALKPAIEAATAARITFDKPAISAEKAGQARAGLRARKAGFRQKLEKVRNRFGINSWIDIRGCNAGDDVSYLQAFSRFFGRDGNLPHVSAPDWYQRFPTLNVRPVADAQFDARAGNPAVVEALEHWSPMTGARHQMELLRSFYDARIAGQTPADPLLVGFPTTAADRSAVAQLLAGPAAGVAQRALARLAAPNAELRYYLESEMVLPVFHQNDYELLVRQQSLGKAIDGWLASQWAPDAPNLKKLQKGSPSAANARRVQGLIPTEEETPESVKQMVFPPDARYWEHIVDI